MTRRISPYQERNISIPKDTYNLLKEYCAASKKPMKRVAEMAIMLLLDRLKKREVEIIYEEKMTLRKIKKGSPHDPEA